MIYIYLIVEKLYQTWGIDNEKYEAMMEYAVLVSDRKENHCNVLLYQFENFYVELFYDSWNNSIVKFKSFTSQELLTPYLNQINLSELQV